MKIIFNTYYPNQKYPNFSGSKPVQITAEQLTKLSNSGQTVKQITENLGITESYYYRLLQKFNIQTKTKKAKIHNASISEDQFVSLIKRGASYQEILKELQITSDTYNTLLAKFGIKTKLKESKEKISAITKEQIETLLQSGKKAKDIAKALDIPHETYSRLLAKFGIITEHKANKLHIAQIDAKTLQQLVDENLPPKEICKKLEINSTAFYRLLKRLKINYNYAHHFGEVKISEERLAELASSGKTTHEIAKELGIAQTTYSQKAKDARIKTKYRDSIDTIDSISKEKLQELINSKMSITEICKRLNITEANYTALLRRYNSDTAQRQSVENISQITKQEILDLRKSDKSVDEICKILNISESSYQRILKRFSLM